MNMNEPPDMNKPLETLKTFFAANPTIGAIACQFEGSGDSGQIDEVFAVEGFTEEMMDDELPPSDFALAPDVLKAAEDVFYQALEKQGIDWYNNDGGFGACAVTASGDVHLRTNQRYSESTLHPATYVLGNEGLAAKGES